ncbi:MAG TPA: hypothetical protein VG733_09990, partial [Chthoniobacteraceae bacterium]|nr:hypothetical protein [Chthoniobacteraceae bacterium]
MGAAVIDLEFGEYRAAAPGSAAFACCNGPIFAIATAACPGSACSRTTTGNPDGCNSATAPRCAAASERSTARSPGVRVALCARAGAACCRS